MVYVPESGEQGDKPVFAYMGDTPSEAKQKKKAEKTFGAVKSVALSSLPQPWERVIGPDAEKPGTLTMGSGGTGSSNQLVGELFQMLTGVKFLHIPYKGAALAATDVMGSQIDMLFDQGSTASGNVRSGKMRGLVVSGRNRMASLPDVPGFAEAGLTESVTVPGAWHMEDAHADSFVVLITNVDDILYKETGGRNRILTERLIKYFKKSYGEEDVTVQYKPQSWNGYALAWSTDGSCVTLSMELHIVQLARDYLPELLDADAPPPADILTGIKLQAAADALCKPEVPPPKMCAAGKETQQIAFIRHRRRPAAFQPAAAPHRMRRIDGQAT
jgi:hypothetical protein